MAYSASRRNITNATPITLLTLLRRWENILRDLSNFYCLSGKAGGSPGGIRQYVEAPKQAQRSKAPDCAPAV